MNCLICGKDIREPIEQFGDIKNPMCRSCYLAGNVWVYNEPVIVDALSRGMNLQDAIKHCVKEEMTELEKFAREILPFTDPTPATSEDDTAAYHGQERAIN